MSRFRTLLTIAHKCRIESLACSALLFGTLACGTGPSDADASSQRVTADVDGQVTSMPMGDKSGETPPDSRLTNCTYTQGFWKNHPDAWPLPEMKLGTTSYTKAQLSAILQKEVDGNGLLALSHQLIAARLNVAFGASPVGLEGTFADADALIGSLVAPPVGSGSLPSSKTSKLNDALTAFNEGKVGPGHCEHGGGPKPPTSSPTPPAGGSTPTPLPPAPMTTPPPAPMPPPPPPQQIVD
jgi:hypothetical protein